MINSLNFDIIFMFYSNLQMKTFMYFPYIKRMKYIFKDLKSVFLQGQVFILCIRSNIAVTFQSQN